MQNTSLWSDASMFKIATIVLLFAAMTRAQEISLEIRTQLEDYSRHCLLASDGSIWSYDLLERAGATAGGLNAPPYNKEDAPLYYDIKAGESVQTKEQLIELVTQRLGYIRLSGRVLEQQLAGIRLLRGVRDVFVDTVEIYAEGSLVQLWVTPDDPYTYTTIEDVERTIQAYRHVEPASAEQLTDWRRLGKYLVDNDLKGLPRHIAGRKLVRPARYDTVTVSPARGREFQRREMVEEAEYAWAFAIRIHELDLPDRWPDVITDQTEVPESGYDGESTNYTGWLLRNTTTPSESQPMR